MNQRIAVLGIGLAVCLIGILGVQASTEASVWDGVYTDEQAKVGSAAYAKECASCHRAELEGHGTNPPLAGSDFLEKWDGQTLDDLFEKIQTSMPADHPGRLSRDQNAAILAFILQFNKFPAGSQNVRTDAQWLTGIRIKAAKPN